MRNLGFLAKRSGIDLSRAERSSRPHINALLVGASLKSLVTWFIPSDARGGLIARLNELISRSMANNNLRKV